MKSVTQISIVTGANRGFGKAIASHLASLKKFEEGELKNHIILVARNEAQMSEVHEEIIKGVVNLRHQIKVVSGTELSDIEGLQTKMNEISRHVKEFCDSNEFKASSEKRIVLFNNAGSLGDVSRKAVQMTSREVLEYSNVNFTSFTHFCIEFKKWQALAIFDIAQIVNTSSLAAVKAFAFNSLYCSMKAARDMYLQVLALEEPSIKTLNYAPGPMDNDMQADMRQKSGDPDTRAFFQSLFDEKKLVKMEDSTSKLLHIVLSNTFESGAHIDFYDYEKCIPFEKN